MPNEERLDKVDESMENLEAVVKERNRSFYQLEVGGTGERIREVHEGASGLDETRIRREHYAPLWLHPLYQEPRWRFRLRDSNNKASRIAYRAWRWRFHLNHSKWKFSQLLRAAETLRRFPETDPEALEEVFPLVSYEEIIRYTRSKSNTRNTHLDVPE